LNASIDQDKQRRESPRGLARPRLLRSALALAVSIVITDAHATALPGGKIRLTLNDEISSRVKTAAKPSFEGRLAVHGLIQSHPHELFVLLEKKYQALPPFTETQDAVAERYIVEATTPQKMLAGVTSFVGNIPQFMPTISSSVRYDDINKSGQLFDSAGNPVDRDYTTVLATVNPTFIYEKEQRKWHLKAKYDYEQGKYFADSTSGINDHTVDIDWTMRLKRGQELNVATIYQNTHDRQTKDPIEDFDSTLESGQLDYNRTLVNLMYRNGTIRDRSRYDAFLFHENSSVDDQDGLFNGYDLKKTGVGGSYTWRVKRQMSLVAEGRYSQFDYDLAFRDNNHYRTLVGTDMLIGRRIRAILRVGYAQKTFDESTSGNSIGEPVWSGRLEWALRRKTSILLETGREVYELATINRPIDATRFNIQDWVRTAWDERWTDKFSTKTSYAYRDTSFKGRDNNEDAQQLIVTAIYQAGTHLQFSIDGAYTRKEDELGEDLSRRTITFRTDYTL